MSKVLGEEIKIVKMPTIKTYIFDKNTIVNIFYYLVKYVKNCYKKRMNLSKILKNINFAILMELFEEILIYLK